MNVCLTRWMYQINNPSIYLYLATFQEQNSPRHPLQQWLCEPQRDEKQTVVLVFCPVQISGASLPLKLHLCERDKWLLWESLITDLKFVMASNKNKQLKYAFLIYGSFNLVVMSLASINRPSMETEKLSWFSTQIKSELLFQRKSNYLFIQVLMLAHIDKIMCDMGWNWSLLTFCTQNLSLFVHIMLQKYYRLILLFVNSVA